MEETKKSLIERVEEIEKEKLVEKASKNKEWKIPFTKRFIGKKKKKEGWVLVCHLGNNKSVWYEKCQIDDGVYMGKDLIPHVVKAEDVFLYKNRLPMIIQPQWSEVPLSAAEHYKITMESGRGTLGWQYIMNYILKTQIKEKRKMAMGGMILVGILVVAGIWYAIKSGAFS